MVTLRQARNYEATYSTKIDELISKKPIFTFSISPDTYYLIFIKK